MQHLKFIDGIAVGEVYFARAFARAANRMLDLIVSSGSVFVDLRRANCLDFTVALFHCILRGRALRARAPYIVNFDWSGCNNTIPLIDAS